MVQVSFCNFKPSLGKILSEVFLAEKDSLFGFESEPKTLMFTLSTSQDKEKKVFVGGLSVLKPKEVEALIDVFDRMSAIFMWKFLVIFNNGVTHVAARRE